MAGCVRRPGIEMEASLVARVTTTWLMTRVVMAFAARPTFVAVVTFPGLWLGSPRREAMSEDVRVGAGTVRQVCVHRDK